MDVNFILANYDAMFGIYPLNEIEAYLAGNINQAKLESDTSTLFTLLNEIIGFCRDTTQKEKALKYCDELLKLLDDMHLEGSYEYATALLNIANAYRAFDKLKESVEFFSQVEKIYNRLLNANDFGYANLYNNWGLTYQELGNHQKAKETLLKALRVVDSYKDALIPQATTRTNLAATLVQMGTEEAYEEAWGYLKRALEIHEANGGQDFHYGATLVAMGDLYSFKKEYEKAAKYYNNGLKEIEKHTGINDNYNRVLEKYNYVKGLCGSNLERSRAFYENVGRKMIQTHFPAYENRIAVGLVGEGSDCYGFDDTISMDHDYDIGFCMWLTEEDYQKIGKDLQKEYEKITHHEGRLTQRRGVFSIHAFYQGLLQTSDYQNAEECLLSVATNGAVFRDDLGVFSGVRERLLAYYPENVWRKKLAQCMHDFSQYAQSNYARMMARKDYITANLCKSKAVESAMDLIYLLNETYAPYYKWKKKGLEKFAMSKKILPLLEEVVTLPLQSSAWENVVYHATQVNTNDRCVELFEEIAKEILFELKKQNLVTGEDAFLELYLNQILKENKKDMVEKIVKLEWKQFDKVNNEGGRAECQDNFQTFSIMRKSQYMAWTEDLLNSFYKDLTAAEEKGWNLIMEKYARMMQSTNPDKYRALENELPKLSEQRKSIQEEIIKIQVNWMEEFAKKYPKMAGNARSIRTSEDSAFNTSYETYLRGEISTYSEETFILYSKFIVSLLQNNRNLAFEIMENTAKLYGYHSLADAERRI